MSSYSYKLGKLKDKKINQKFDSTGPGALIYVFLMMTKSVRCL